MGERHLATLAAYGLQLGQLVESVGHSLHVRWVDETEVRDVFRRTGHAHGEHVQHHRA